MKPDTPLYIKDPLGNAGKIVEHIPRGMAYVADDKPVVCYILKEKLSNAPRKELFTAEYMGKEGNGDSGIDIDIVREMAASGKGQEKNWKVLVEDETE